MSLLVCVFLSVSVGCAEDVRRGLIDVDGPRGRAVGPGPWSVTAVSRSAAPTVWYQLDEGPLGSTPMNAVEGETALYVGALPVAPTGALFEYYVEAGGERIPPEGRWRFVVVDRADSNAQRPTPDCIVAFQQPTNDELLGPRDDVRPEAGLQVIPRIVTDASDGTVARLLVGQRGYAGASEGGLFAFGPVTMPVGTNDLAIDVLTELGARCRAQITVEVRAEPER